MLESVLLGLAGACAGLVLAYGGIELVRVLGLEDPSDGFELALDARVVVVTLSAALAAALLSSLLPLFELRRDDLARAVQESGRANTGGVAMRRWRSGLVVVQLALGVAILAGAGLLTKTFYDLLREGPGFEPAGVWSAGVEFPTRRDTRTTRHAHGSSSRCCRSCAPFRESRLPGFTTMLPFVSSDYGATVVVDGRQPLDGRLWHSCGAAAQHR